MDLATIQEANRLRVEMGMKPLPVPGEEPEAKGSDEEDEDPLATLDGRHALAFDNYKKVQDAELAKRRREEKAEAVKRAREKAQRHAVLEGHTLGELEGGILGNSDKGDGADGDAKAWLRGQKQRQKKITKQSEAEAAAEEEERQRRKRLVGHDMSALLDGGDQILTLRDATVLENEDDGDELENMELREHEKLQERLDLKKKRVAYDPLTMTDDETPGSRTILGQYDEEIHGKKRKTFTLDPNAILGPDGNSAAAGKPATVLDMAAGGLSSKHSVLQHVDLNDLLAGGPSSDYVDASELKIRKPKKKSKEKKAARATRRRGGGGGDNGDDDVLFPAEATVEDDAKMDVDTAAVEAAAAADRKQKKRRAMEEADEDLMHDEESLQAVLAVQRREALKKRKRMRPEDVAKQLREASAEGADGEGEGQQGGGLVIDETAEFISNLKRREDREDELPRARKQTEPSSVTAMDADSSEDENGQDVEMKDEQGGEQGERTEGQGAAAGLEEEKKISEGMGATLSILRGRGILESEGGGGSSGNGGNGGEGGSSGGSALNTRMRAHQQFLAEKRLRLAKLEEDARRRREQDRAAGGALARMTAREREEYARRQNAQREFQTSRMLQDMFAEKYTPNFQIEYTDEHGRSLNAKEAFRELSHGFHGKTSGRGKTDKMLKRIAAEKRHMAEGILDASEAVGMSSAAQQQLKKRKEAGVRLD
ncbi:DNA-binding protein [Grosmannia clavigera kw1407]|uniref:DNA-binding protein n=1 Tax=Grosmannia clavigera (strain kw1407 / UAMH 11150) TaxID=655863 RepID=F0X809_GROCL|nr:DNA-binding protein [Grosmannia clavigera kw1407]EFX06274.1 DNA-binding protein [Grosmannia clavigera kw1407]